MGSGIKGLSSHEWVSILKEGIVSEDVEEEVVLAFLKHLADLGIMESLSDDFWRATQAEAINSKIELKNQLSLRLQSLDPDEMGFAVKYFIAPAQPFLATDRQRIDIRPVSSGPETAPSSMPDVRRKASSDLSNLQIVRKMGRQLSPFIEFEKEFIRRLEGGHVKRDDAKKIFKYVMSKIRDKEKPREWEQLSRKRHK